MPSKAEIIAIGDEILYGQTLDTNSYWISQELDTIGIQVIKKIMVGDVEEDIIKALEQAESNADIILITGGLGPTHDDITKSCLVKYFNTHLIQNNEVLENLQYLFQTKKRKITDINEAQAHIPANCTPIKNAIGTAPGMWFERNGKVMISMPGVPYEMKQMMVADILPKLQKHYTKGGIYHRMIRTIGISESKLAEKIKDWEVTLPRAITLAYLPMMSCVKIRLTAKGNDQQFLCKAMQEQIDKILPTIEKYVYGFDNEEIEEVIGRMLKERGLKLSIAESCTGGFLSHKITSVPGSSKWFHGSAVLYSNQLKNEQLHIPNELLLEHGAVSKPVVLALAKNVKKMLKTDVGVSVSGITGPSGGTPKKPVGTVWIGYADEHKTVAKKFCFGQDRTINIQYSAIAALNMIRINLERG